MKKITVCALYKFINLPHYQDIQTDLIDFCKQREIKGSLLLAHEGINGTVAGTQEHIDDLLDHLQNTLQFGEIDYKLSFDDDIPFYRLKIKLKKEIVTMGVDNINPSLCVGTYVNPQDWNALISDPEVLLIDTRNQYEFDIGSFKGAINPETSTFREFPDYVEKNLDKNKNKKVAMFCTGGIRCEKSTAYLKQLGFDNVYHLKGGVLKYLEEVNASESLWQGECFVFDQRVAVTHGLKVGKYDLCHGCRYPIDASDKQSEKYIEGVSCPKCYDKQSDDQRTRFAERQKQIKLAEQRGEKHFGIIPPHAQSITKSNNNTN